MSSGSLSLASYHRAQSLGSGAYGDVLTVYDDDGVEFAIKLFEPTDARGETDSDDDESTVHEELNVVDLGTFREISILRVLRHENAHKNVIQIHDLKQNDSALDEHNNGEDLMSNIGLIMPLYKHGNLSDAINSSIFTNKRMKVKIAHGILNAIAFLHCNGIIHRDIKGDNIMLEINENNGEFYPILIDFSLAKIIEPQIFSNASGRDIADDNIFLSRIENESTHTPDCGTVTYKAPEVLNEEPYGLAADMYSVGVVLLELLTGKTLEATRDKEARRVICDTVENLPNQPFAMMIKGLVDVDPLKRLTAEEALKSEAFVKYGCSQSESSNLINLKNAIPLEEIYDDDEYENIAPSKRIAKATSKRKNRLRKRLKLIQRLAHVLESKNPLTIHAAVAYAEQLSQLEDCDDLKKSQALCDCVVLAHKFFEEEIWNIHEIEKLDEGIFRDFEWSADIYRDNEESIFVMMDFCLYPRELLDLKEYL